MNTFSKLWATPKRWAPSKTSQPPNSGGATSGIIADLNVYKVTPLLKGTKGKIRPITVGTTITQCAHSLDLRKTYQKPSAETSSPSAGNPP